MKSKLAVGMSDGWKDIRMKSLLASTINVKYKADGIEDGYGMFRNPVYTIWRKKMYMRSVRNRMGVLFCIVP